MKMMIVNFQLIRIPWPLKIDWIDWLKIKTFISAYMVSLTPKMFKTDTILAHVISRNNGILEKLL